MLVLTVSDVKRLQCSRNSENQARMVEEYNHLQTAPVTMDKH